MIKKRCEGVTLIELLVVIAIIGILLAISMIIGARYINKRIIDKDAYLIKTYLSRARQLSITKGIEKNEIYDNYSLYGVIVNSDNDTISIINYISNIWNPSDLSNSKIVVTENLKSDILDNSSDYILFNKKGFVVGLGGTIYLSYKGYYKEIKYNQSGYARIE